MAVDELEASENATDVSDFQSARTAGKESLIRVGAAQTHPRIGRREENLRQAVELLREAVDGGVDLMVLPELGNSGYMFNSRSEARALSERIPDGPTCRALLDVIAGTKLHVVAGICENDGSRLYNAAAVLGPEGYVGTYRKNHLWDEETLFFEPGNLGFPVFQLPFGRVGVMICYDGWFPESARILKLQGADIICDPTCWVLVPGIVEASNPVSAYVHMAQAHLNSVFIVCADRCGIERGCTFIGNSCIAGPSGFVAGPASFSETELLTADINLSAARYHHWTALADPIADRRIDLYESRLGYRSALFEQPRSSPSPRGHASGGGALADRR